MNHYINNLKALGRFLESEIVEASKTARLKLVEEFSCVMRQISHRYKELGEDEKAKIYSSKAEVYDDDDF